MKSTGLVLAVALGLVLAWTALAPDGAAPAAAVERVVVENFPPVQEVAGSVRVVEPVPHARLVEMTAVVAPVGPEDLNQLTRAGVLDTAGFTHAVLSLAGEVQGPAVGEAEVGAILVPDRPRIVEALQSYGRLQFPLRVAAPVHPGGDGLFESQPTRVSLAFPRYRVYLYDTAPRSVEATLYVYLTN